MVTCALVDVITTQPIIALQKAYKNVDQLSSRWFTSLAYGDIEAEDTCQLTETNFSRSSARAAHHRVRYSDVLNSEKLHRTGK
jgi:hypothetical protein